MTIAIVVLYVLGGALLALLVVSLVWRFGSRRWSWPCPSWAAPLFLEAWSDRLIGTSRTLDRIGLHPGQRVLEIGPGPGRLLIPAARRVLPGGEVVGLDIQAAMLERLRAKASAPGIENLTMILGDASSPHVAAESFDVVYLCTVLGEIPDRVGALEQCYRALRSGGQLSITEIIGDPHYQTRRTVERLARQVGFRPITVSGNWRMYTANFEKP